MQDHILWQPTHEDIRLSKLNEYRHWLKAHHGLEWVDYESMWAWSVDHLETFWETVAAFFEVKFHHPYSSIISGGLMPD
ncbi:MAG TPA: acetyl-coenzyme A synthetase N-terminal domain-containing protein, partial [Chitinophagaceae bacterium]|nr:acetyl-coenzyme A synthetase N-terminal domain-containing protein [Chitinophagaceae bacterium]